MLPDTKLMEEAQRLAEAAANEDDSSDATAETQPAAEPELVDVTLGDRAFKLPAELAPEVRRAFDSLAGRYGSELENLRARAYAQPQVVQQYVQPPAPSADATFNLPKPDLMFSDEPTYRREFNRALEERLARERAGTEALVQTAVGIVQSELDRREAARQANEYENSLFSETLEKHDILQGNESYFWSVMDEIYPDVRHLRATDAYARAGEIAESRLRALGVGANGNAATAAAAAPRSPTPRVLSGGRASGGTEAVPPRRVSISDHILARQEKFLDGRAPAK